MFKVLLHKDFLARVSRVLRRYRSLNRPLINRMIYRLDEREGAIVPLYLSDKPRNEATYRDWNRAARRIIVDFEERQHDLFEEWQGEF